MIVRDGWTFIIAGFLLTIIILIGAIKWDSRGLLILSAIFALLTIFTALFFRDPDRSSPKDPKSLVASADGKIVAIKEIENHPFVGGPAIRVSIFLSIFDVHVNRVPAEGTIDYVKYNPGKFFAAFEEKASEKNEQTEIGMTTITGHKIVFSQIAGIIARRIVCNLKDGDKVTKGERFGLIRFGSRSDLIIPKNCELKVKIGDNVTGGVTEIAYLKAANSNNQIETNVNNNNAEH